MKYWKKLKPWIRYAIGYLAGAIFILVIGLMNSTNHMVFISRGWPFEWYLYNNEDTMIVLPKLAASIAIALVIAVVLSLIWKFVKVNIEANYELERKWNKKK